MLITHLKVSTCFDVKSTFLCVFSIFCRVYWSFVRGDVQFYCGHCQCPMTPRRSFTHFNYWFPQSCHNFHHMNQQICHDLGIIIGGIWPYICGHLAQRYSHKREFSKATLQNIFVSELSHILCDDCLHFINGADFRF